MTDQQIKTKEMKDFSKILDKKNKKQYQRKSPATFQTISIITIVVMIFGYILFDLVMFKPESKHKMQVVYEKFDSLEVFLAKKLPEIDNAIKLQDAQVKYLQKMTEDPNTINTSAASLGDQ